MQFSRSFLLALFSAVAYGQTSSGSQPNPFTYDPATPFSVTAGEPVEITWEPTTGGTVTLRLRQGNSGNLSEGIVIAENIDNDGSYTWTPDANTVRGTDYALQIVDDQDTSQFNYSPPFTIASDNTVASSTNTAPTSSLSLSTTSTPTASPSASPTSSSSSSETTGTSTASETSSSSETSSATSSGGDLQASSTSQAGGARATAMAGMLGMVALGALAL